MTPIVPNAQRQALGMLDSSIYTGRERDAEGSQPLTTGRIIAMKKLIAIGLAGLLGCASPPDRGPAITGIEREAAPEPGLPRWVEVPTWVKQLGPHKRSEVDPSVPSVCVVTRVCTWSADELDIPALSADGYAILGDAEADRIMRELASSSSASMLTSPRVVLGLNQSSWVAVLSSDKGEGRQNEGVVFFANPTAIDEGGVDLRFSLQCARYPADDQRGSTRLKIGIAKLEGQARLGIGQWYARPFEGDYPLVAGTDMTLLIQVVRVEHPNESDAGLRKNVLSEVRQTGSDG